MNIGKDAGKIKGDSSENISGVEGDIGDTHCAPFDSVDANCTIY